MKITIKKRFQKKRNKTYNNKKNYFTHNNLIEKLRYFENIEENNCTYKYSLSKVYNVNNSIYYICADTHCNGRLKIQYDFDLNSKKIEEFNIKEIKLTKLHNISYEDHNNSITFFNSYF